MDLFKYGTFLLHSGEVSSYKIECEALGERDWFCLARIIEKKFRFSRVIGVPRGGLPLQRALEPYATHCATDPVLIVDDVYTTGNSMRRVYESVRESWAGEIVGVVVFARNEIGEDWIYPIWQRQL